MSEVKEETRQDQPEPGNLTGKAVSRREFLKIAGIAGATVGMGAGLGGLVAACGGTTTTTAAGSSPTVTSGATAGREIKLGFVSPLTGPLASFGVPDKYCVDRWKEAVGDGLVLGDGQKHPISITTSDSQSDSNRAAQVAGDLINNTKVDMMMVASTPDTVTPVVEQCEASSVPVVSTDCPWQTYLGNNFANGYKWSYHVFFGGEDSMTTIVKTCDTLSTNKIAGFMLPNDADGNFYRKVFPGFLTANGYKPVDGGSYQDGTEDFTSSITLFKSQGCEIVTGIMIPPDFTNFWKQSKQQGFNPKVAFDGKAMLFPQSVEALGDVGNGLLAELWWHRTFPFKSSLTGETCAQLADDFETKTGQQETAPLLHYVAGEMALYALKNATDPTNNAAILAAVEKMKFDSIAGPIDFTAPLVTPTGSGITDYPAGPGHKRKNVYDHGIGAAQWLMLGGKWKFEEVPVNNAAAPYMTADSMKPAKALPIT